mmetsp:Transcript_15584/g.26575  ORF Transcript_15584/g.26575 Transcript_15584/m.26575 type:complete len:220 (+) Transcript_15584:207-866(+)
MCLYYYADVPFSSFVQLKLFYLLLSSQIQSTLGQSTTTVVDLDNITISSQFSILSHPNIILTLILGKSPLETLQNLLPSSKLELSTTDRLNNVWLGSILSTHGKKNLSNINTGGNTNGLTVRVPHSTGKPISSSARKHLVGTDNMVRVHTNTDMVRILSNSVDQMLVNSNTACLKCLRGDLLLLVTDQVSNEGEQVHGSLLGSHVVNTDLGLGHTTAVA